MDKDFKTIKKMDPNYCQPHEYIKQSKVPQMRLRIANWLKVKNKDILYDRRYNSTKCLAALENDK